MATSKSVRSLASRLKGKVPTQSKRHEPLWQGPESDGPNGGVTQSLLSRWLCCRERCRLLCVEGLRPADTFNHRLEYGQMWHTCEEEYARTGTEDNTNRALKQYASQLCQRYPLQQEQVKHWYNVCKVQFPVYCEYWAKHPDVKQRTPLMQEQVFCVPYVLPSGRTVYLRGKWDGVDQIGKRGDVYLQENKTKGEIVEEQLKRQLQFDLQTMLYVVALDHETRRGGKLPANAMIKGVRYNVVRRPLAGGKDSIRQKQDETPEAFYERLGALIADHPDYYFMRWRVELTSQDVQRFQHEFLNPCLEELCSWWEWIGHVGDDPFYPAKHLGHSHSPINHLHYRTPYGIYNVLAEGGSSELDEYLASGSELGLERGTVMFKELCDE